MYTVIRSEMQVRVQVHNLSEGVHSLFCSSPLDGATTAGCLELLAARKSRAPIQGDTYVAYYVNRVSTTSSQVTNRDY